MNFLRKWAVALGAVIPLISAAQTPGPERAQVVVVRPETKQIEQTVKLPGIMNADERVPVYAKVPGYIAMLNVDKGYHVKAGEVMAELSVPEMEPELALAKAKAGSAQALLAKARAGVEVETVTHQRLSKLHDAEPGAVTQEDVDVSTAKEKTARAEAEAARAEINVADADVRRIEALMTYLKIPAPFDGTVTERFFDNGAFVSPAEAGSKPIVEVARVSVLRLTFELPERLVPFIKPGYPLRYSLTALPGKLFEGAVTRRTESLTADAHTMRTEADVDNTESRFAPGMYASVQIPLGHVPGMSVLPAATLRTVDGKSCVFVVEDGKLKKTPIDPLLTEKDFAVVSGELTPASSVVLSGPATLTDGQSVEAVERK